jgi:DNA-binding CsgD family transcriptional regulator
MPPRNLALEVMGLDSVEAIDRLMAETVSRYGLTAYAGGMVTGPIAHSSLPLYFMNWPANWRAIYAERGWIRKDPAPRWALVSGAPVAWTDIIATLPRNDPGHEVYAEAIAYGYREGLVVPIRTADGSLGLVSSGGDRERLQPDEIAILAAFFTAALLRAEALTGASRPSTPSPLTLRERECTSLLVQGFADAQIAATLGISSETVRFHLDNARKKLGARSRAQLAAIASGIPGQPD